ncbi:hypothetical protein CB337_22075 [Salmonella enterica subsp. enterica serovar Agbeni]|nr:hypothetical protein [Salmonella enterica subsp. enterica serovar Agbeni]
MKKIIIATIVSLGLGFGAGYAYLDQTTSKTIEEQSKTISDLKVELGHLTEQRIWNDERYQELYAERQRLFDERNAGIIFASRLCKKMGDSRTCLMELGLKTNTPVDFKD